MGNILGTHNHLTGETSGNIPGSSGEKSRVGQGAGVPKTPGGTGRVPRSVSGVRSYGIRHAPVTKVGAVQGTPAAASGKLPSIPKASKLPKLSNEI